MPSGWRSGVRPSGGDGPRRKAHLDRVQDLRDARRPGATTGRSVARRGKSDMNFEPLIPMPPDAVVVSLAVPGDPVAHQRPRFGRKGQVYTPNESLVYRDKVTLFIRQLVAPTRDAATKFGVQVRFFRSNRQRIDADNLLKSVLDACTQAGLWRDDSQVREVAAKVWLGQADPRTEFVVYRIVDPSPGTSQASRWRSGPRTNEKPCAEPR